MNNKFQQTKQLRFKYDCYDPSREIPIQKSDSYWYTDTKYNRVVTKDMKRIRND